MPQEQQQINVINRRLNRLQRAIHCGEILYSDGALSGSVACNYKLGVNSTTGDVYYKDDNNTWQLIISSGGGGSSFSSVKSVQSVIGNGYTLTNTTEPVTGLDDGSTSIQSADFANAIVQVFINEIFTPPIDPQTGDVFWTKDLASDTIVLSSPIIDTNPIVIYIFGVADASAQNISNAALTANGDYTQNWNNHTLDFEGISTLNLVDNNGNWILVGDMTTTTLGAGGSNILSGSPTSTLITVGGVDSYSGTATDLTISAGGSQIIIASASATGILVAGNELLSAGTTYTRLFLNGDSFFETSSVNTLLGTAGNPGVIAILPNNNVGFGTSTPDANVRVEIPDTSARVTFNGDTLINSGSSNGVHDTMVITMWCDTQYPGGPDQMLSELKIGGNSGHRLPLEPDSVYVGRAQFVEAGDSSSPDIVQPKWAAYDFGFYTDSLGQANGLTVNNTFGNDQFTIMIDSGEVLFFGDDHEGALLFRVSATVLLTKVTAIAVAT